jgi:hypothetical protein
MANSNHEYDHHFVLDTTQQAVVPDPIAPDFAAVATQGLSQSPWGIGQGNSFTQKLNHALLHLALKTLPFFCGSGVDLNLLGQGP